MTNNLVKELLTEKERNHLTDFIFDVISSKMSNSRKFKNIIEYLENIEL